jgi:hypothetical protein
MVLSATNEFLERARDNICPKFRIDFVPKIALFSLASLYHIDLKGDE